MNNYTITDFTKLKPVNYTRKSSESEDRQMLSVISQKEEAQRIANFYKIPKFIEVFEESKSAKKEFMRPEFTKMLTMIKSGQVDTIVCWKLDRLARNMTEGGIIIDLISSGIIKAIITHDKVYYPTDNVLLMAVEFGQGKQYVKDLSANVKRGQTKKASMGIPHGVATLGFLNDKTEEKGNRKWLVDSVRLEIIKTLFEMFLTGTYSAGKLHKHAIGTLKLTTVKRKRSGGNPITLSRIYEILKDPIYAGFFYYGNERFELDVALPRIITEDQHNKVKMLLAKANIPKVQSHDTVFSGFITSEKGEFIGQDVKFQVICDCKKKFAYRNKVYCPQCGIEVDNMSKPKYLSYIHYYNVKKKKSNESYKSVREEAVNRVVMKFVEDNLTFSEDLVQWSKKYIHEMKDKEFSQKVLISERKEERKIELQDKKAKMRALLRDGQVTQEEYSEDIARLEKDYEDTKQDIKSIDWYSRLIEITDITSCILNVLKNGNIESKRKMMSVLGSNLVWNEENLIIHNTPEINALVSGVKLIKSIYPEFEPRKYVVNKGSNEKTEPKDPVFSIMLRE